MTETWIPWAIRRPGPPEKVGYGPLRSSAKEGIVAHSMEGALAGALAELDRHDRQASWHVSIATDGTIYQHYSTDDICWASGSYEANRRFIAIEHEGRAGEPLTSAQIEALARVIAWCADVYGWRVIQRQVTLWEHREMVQFGSAPTACPSGRIPWGEVIAGIERLRAVSQLEVGGGLEMDPRLDTKVKYKVIGPALDVLSKEASLYQFLLDCANGLVIFPKDQLQDIAIEDLLDKPVSIFGEPPQEQKSVRQHLANIIDAVLRLAKNR